MLPDPQALLPRIELGAASRTPPAFAPHPPRSAPASVEQASAKPPASVRWETTLESTQRRPLQTLTVGTGPQRVFLTSNLSGNDPDSVRVADALARQLTAPRDSKSDATVLLLRTPNPDGLAERISTNARGVDLNRNFPSARFTATPTRQTGPYAASEAETRGLLRLLAEFKPLRVIHIRAGRGTRGVLFASASAVSDIASVIDKSRFEVRPFDGDFKAGSLEEFAAHRLKAEVIVCELPRSLDTQREADVTAVMQITLGARTTAAPSPGEGPPPREPFADGRSHNRGEFREASPAALSGVLEPDEPDGQKGYVELLPPPPDVRPEHGESLDDPKYHELSPPQ